MNILAIETSCDDTCVAVIRASGKKKFNLDILSNVVSSQVEVHKKYGGVYPTLAKREHQRNLVPVLKQSLLGTKLLKSKIKKEPRARLRQQKSKINIKIQNLQNILKREKELHKKLKEFLEKYQKPKIDAIAVTIGPGLDPCLWVGINFAKALSYFWNLPIIPVNHIEAHIFANWLLPISSKLKIKKKPRARLRQQKIDFPAVCLVVSGGHTQLIFIKNFGKYEILGETRDDAAGECFDKVARILGLGYPGGPAIATEAAKYTGRTRITLPRPMLKQKNYDFSFSGLKTAVLYKVKEERSKIKDEKYIQNMCWEVQQSIIDVLIKKTIRAAKAYRVKAIILGGGVTANNELRKQFAEVIKKELPNIQYLTPNIQFCTDNAAMVGAAGYFGWLRRKTKPWRDIEAKANLRII